MLITVPNRTSNFGQVEARLINRTAFVSIADFLFVFVLKLLFLSNHYMGLELNSLKIKNHTLYLPCQPDCLFMGP